MTTVEISPERRGFLRSIKAEPGNDTIRLAYADYLEEHGEGDLDRATGEFIKAGCRLGGADNLMAPKAYAWLDANWPRLIPSVVGLHAGFDDEHKATNLRIWLRDEKSGRRERRFLPDSGIPFVRHGRTVCFGGYRKARLTEIATGEYIPFEGIRRVFTTKIEFWKGFVQEGRLWGTRWDRFDTDNPLGGLALLKLDQPFLDIR